MLAGIALFRPTTLALTQGQFIALMLLMVMLMAIFFDKEKWGLGGIFLGSLVLKPNLGLIFIPLIITWLIFQKKWKPIFTALSAAIVLLLIGLAYDPGWVGEYLQVGGSKLAQTFGGSPTV